MTFLSVTKPVGYAGIRYSVAYVELEEPVETDIEMRAFSRELVSPFEENDARLEAGYNLIEWLSLSRWQRALEVAMYRIRNSIKAHQAEKDAQKMRAQSKAGK